MAQAGYTPIQLYYSTTASAAPSSGNLANGELALNITDGKLYYKDNGGVVQVLATKAGASGDVVGPASSTDNALVRFDGTTGKLVQSSVGVLSDAGALSGLTGLTSSGSITFSGLTSGRLTYATTGGLLTDSANLTFDGTTLTANALTVSNAVTLSGGTANGVAYLNGSKVLTTGSALTFNGSTLATTGALTVSGNTTLGDASTDTVTVNGYMGVGGAGSASNSVVAVSSALTGSGQGGFYANITGTSAGTNELSGFRSYIATAATAYTVSDVSNFRAFNAVKGAGSTITNQHGLYIADQTQGTNNYGVTSLVSSGTNKWNIYASGTAQNYFNGDVGINVAVPETQLDIYNPSGTTGLVVKRSTTMAAAPYVRLLAGAANGLMDFTGGLALRTSAVGGTPAEVVRIDSSGNLLVGTTSTGPVNANAITIEPANSRIRVAHASTANGTPYIQFDYNGVNIGSITQSTTSSVAYNTSSDYRLKENIQPMTGALAKVAALKPCTYKWKADGSDGEGFIAHELAEVVPQCVTGEKDAVDADGKPIYQGIDTSFLVATLTAAIQEQQTIINQLKSRLDAANL